MVIKLRVQEAGSWLLFASPPSALVCACIVRVLALCYGNILACFTEAWLPMGSGFKPCLRTYDGSEIPQPLCIDVQQAKKEFEQVPRDIFAITTLNYNRCELGENQPVTIDFPSAIAKSLSAIALSKATSRPLSITSSM